jgi:hypothetical protein
LKTFWKDSLFDRLEALARQYNAVIRYQEDGAGPHRCNIYRAFIADEFAARGWMYAPQPGQSPIVNVSDACIFPTMSKQISQQQLIKFGPRVLRADELIAEVERAWLILPLSTIARSFAGHHQIVCAILDAEGGNNFLRDNTGLHFGVRKTYVNTEDGVEELCHTYYTEGEPSEFLAREGLTFDPPSLQECFDNGGTLSCQEMAALFK